MSEQAPPTTPPGETDQGALYGASYYRHDCGIPYERNDHWLSFFNEAAEGIVRSLHPSSVLDAGCAMGFLVEGLRRRGVDAWGVDVSEYAISQVDESVSDRCSVGSVTEPFDRRYDLITCIEVLEHLPPAETDRAIANLCASTDRLLLSTTPADFGEATHLNVQPPEAWSALLAREGFMRDLDLDFSFLTPWASLYTRRDEETPETVRRYDRGWWRLRTEATELRKELLAASDRVAELEAGDGVEQRPGLLAELDRSNAEILRLRDLLIGMDAELGTAKGWVAEYEDRSERWSNAKERLETQVPIFGKLIGRLWTLLRGRR